MRWEFQAVNPDGTLGALDKRQRALVPQYEAALAAACASEAADPIFSGFRVRSSMGGVPGGNIEYGFCQALHSEEFAGAAFRAVSSFTQGIVGIPVFGLAAHAAGKIATPCGNCRDFLLDAFGPDLETVYGHPDGGVATVIPLRQYLFDGYWPFPVYQTLQQAAEKVLQYRSLEYDPYSPSSVHPERRYLVTLFTRYHQYYGARDVGCDFHPIYPMQDAIRAARHDLQYSLLEVLIVAEDIGDRPPHVMYRDRQHLLEYNLIEELATGQEQDPRVLLVSVREGSIARVWQTSVKEWLPRPFSPRNFADMDRLTAYAREKARVV